MCSKDFLTAAMQVYNTDHLDNHRSKSRTSSLQLTKTKKGGENQRLKEQVTLTKQTKIISKY
jgi:hypothetical protein